MKKLITLIIAIALTFSLTACGGEDASVSEPASAPANTAPANEVPANEVPADQVAQEHNIYSIPILLNGEDYNLSVVYDFTAEEYTIEGARKSSDESGAADKNLRYLVEGDKVQTIHYANILSDENDDSTGCNHVCSIRSGHDTRGCLLATRASAYNRHVCFGVFLDLLGL